MMVNQNDDDGRIVFVGYFENKELAQPGMILGLLTKSVGLPRVYPFQRGKEYM